MLFECRITLRSGTMAVAEKAAGIFHWKTSQIYGDPVLGKEQFVYLTSHSDDYMKMFERMKHTCSWLREVGEVDVIREKIELIMYDTKQKDGT